VTDAFAKWVPDIYLKSVLKGQSTPPEEKKIPLDAIFINLDLNVVFKLLGSRDVRLLSNIFGLYGTKKYILKNSIVTPDDHQSFV